MAPNLEDFHIKMARKVQNLYYKFKNFACLSRELENKDFIYIIIEISEYFSMYHAFLCI